MIKLDDKGNVIGGTLPRKKPSNGSPKSGKPTRPPQEADDWQIHLLRTEKGKPVAAAANVAVYLRHDPAWAGVLEYDERVGAARFASVPPIPRDLANPRDVYPREVADADLVRIQSWCAREHRFNVGLDAIHGGLDTVAAQRPRDPVREYLDALVWDGVPRLDHWTETYLGAQGTEYSRGVAARWLISGVARSYQPGCQADHVLVLEGPQGSGKSSALRVLAGPPEFFSDEVQAIGTKDAADSLRGPWIVELAELDAANRADVSTLKAFVSRRIDRYRAAYGRRTLNHPRRVIFAASTNEHAYAKDATGSRRLWPLRTGAIRLDALERDRDQLWAEARERYRAGATWWPDAALAQLCADEQDARFSEDAWQSAIDAYLRDERETTVREVGVEALGIELPRLGQAEQNRIVRCLQRMGWGTTGNPVARVIAGRQARVRVYTAPRIGTGAP